MRVRRTLMVLLGIVVASIGGCVSGFAFLAWMQPDQMTLPAPTGEHPVGRILVDWRDDGRADPLAVERGVPRELPVWIWYPADPEAATPTADYLPPQVADAIDSAAVPLLRATLGALATDQRRVRVHALDAPAVAAGRFPIVVMRPARGGLSPQYSILAEDLASHGYVVVGADMPHTTRVVSFADGHAVRRTTAGAPPELAPGRASPLAPGLPNDLFLPVLDVLVADGTFLLDRLAELDASDARFAGRLDLDSVGVFGHSVGGTVALELCKIEPRCVAGIDIDGYVMGSSVETGLGKPFMFLMSDRRIFRRPVDERTAPERELLLALDRIRQTLPNRVQLVIVQGMDHFGFGDSAVLSSPALRRLAGARIDGERGLEVTRAYVRAFFDVHLKGRSERSLADLGLRFAEAQVD